MKKKKGVRSKDPDDFSTPLPQAWEERWNEKREALLEKLTAGHPSAGTDKKDLQAKKKILRLEIEALEEENHKLARSTKEFEFQITKKKRTYQSQLEKGDDLGKKLVRLSTRERSILNEMALYRSEQVRLTGKYAEISKTLGENIASLKELIDRISFTKGESKTLTEKMAMIEGDIPAQSGEVGSMEETIKHSFRELRRFSDRIQGIEKDLLINYYEKKQHARE